MPNLPVLLESAFFLFCARLWRDRFCCAQGVGPHFEPQAPPFQKV